MMTDVLILMGSASDEGTMRHIAETLSKLGISWDPLVVSAHRTPNRLGQHVTPAEGRGYKIIIAGAGLAAALPGDASARTILPVIGVPLPGSSSGSEDAAVRSMVYMPSGTPVGVCGAPGNHGAINAALHAASILAISDPDIRERYRKYRDAQSDKVPLEPEWPDLIAQNSST